MTRSANARARAVAAEQSEQADLFSPAFPFQYEEMK